MNTFSKYVALFLIVATVGCGRNREGIDRKAVVSRHNVVNTAIDSLTSLTVGNGAFAFTVDITGLQTFPHRYAKGVSLGTQSEWGWDRFTDTVGYRFEETLQTYDFNNDGRKASYSIQHKEGRQREASNGFRQNPHRLQLGNIGFDIYGADGRLMTPDDVTDIEQTLDLWTGEIRSQFKAFGEPVEVTTVGHQEADAIAVKVHSPLIESGRLKVRIRYPYPTAQFLDEANFYAHHDRHQTAIADGDAGQEAQTGGTLVHEMDSITYYTVMRWTDGATLAATDTAHYYQVSPSADQDEFALTVLFSQEAGDPAALPDFAATAASSSNGWEAFWSRGAAIDFAGSTDPRVNELERRVVLSQYLTKVQCAGHIPPQETGLTFNSWYGKPHLEMHWWHAVHFALWGRAD